jgi:hypothetical protein
MKLKIKQRYLHFQTSLAGACGVLLTLCAVQVGLTQQSARMKPAATEENAHGAPAKPGDEGIKVHGHWTIDIKNPDGTLAQHHEFENSFQPGGSIAIIQLITGIAIPSDMGIGVTSPTGHTPPCGPSSQSICLMVRSLKDEPGTSFCVSLAVCSANLTSATSFAALPYTLTYSGSFQAEEAGSITGVQSILGSCVQSPAGLETVSPANCTADNLTNTQSGQSYAIFSGTTISAVAVTAGQIVQVSVAFTFS